MTYSNISKSKELYNKLNSIAQELLEYQENQRQYEKDDPFFISLDVLEEKFTLVLKSLIHQSAEDNFFWQYCPIEVYRRYFQKRKENFVDKYLNSTATDFINEEIELLKSDKWNYYFPNPRYGGENVPVPFSSLSNDLHRTLIFIKKRKEEFLKAELNKNDKNPEFYADYHETILPPNYLQTLNNRNKVFAGFIVFSDNSKKLELLPYTEFIRRYNQLSEKEQINFLFELKRIILNGAISKEYLLKEWQKINLKTFVFSQLDSINRNNDLETKLRITEKSEMKETCTRNDFPEIFKADGYSVFRLLNENYQNSNKKLRAKYSYLYHYLKYEDLLRCNQLEYIDFIKEQFGIEMSKILPKTLKYVDDIQSLLAKYHKGLQ